MEQVPQNYPTSFWCVLPEQPVSAAPFPDTHLVQAGLGILLSLQEPIKARTSVWQGGG